MKKLLLLISFVITTLTISAQAPDAFNYQAVVRDNSGNIITNQDVKFQINILQGAVDGATIYSETHAVQANGQGLVNMVIGTGTSTDDMSTINWGSDSYYIQINLDINGGENYELMGTSQLLSVPYALHAKTAESVSEELLARIEKLEVAAGIGMQDIDGNTYKIVTIGNQIWMAENLKTTKFADGTNIPTVYDTNGDGDINEEWAALPDDNVSMGYTMNDDYPEENYGAYYSWAAIMYGSGSSNTNPSQVQGVCPDGWHVPSEEEWKELRDYIRDNGYSNSESIALKTKDGWNDGGNGTNVYEFNALPAGDRASLGGAIDHEGNTAYFWTSTEGNSTQSRYVTIRHNSDVTAIGTANKSYGMSVRCVKGEASEDDIESPNVEISKPVISETYIRGSDLPFVATFSDNVGLKKATITIEYISQSPRTVLKGIGAPWNPADNNEMHVVTLSGKSDAVNISQLFNQSIEAACLGGDYRLTIKVEDIAGNELVTELDIKIG